MAGYSTDIGKNLQILSDELDYDDPFDDVRRLFMVWAWAGRADLGVEEGVFELLERGGPTSTTVDRSLNCPVFLSSGRSLVLQACGWGQYAEAAGEGYYYDMESCYEALEDCEGLGDWERAAALAVFRGDLRAALYALKRAQEPRPLPRGAQHEDAVEPSPSELPLEERQLLQLVAMSVSGYTGGVVNQLWKEASEDLLLAPLLKAGGESGGEAGGEAGGESGGTGGGGGGGGHPYLRALCVFLLAVSDLDEFGPVDDELAAVAATDAAGSGGGDGGGAFPSAAQQAQLWYLEVVGEGSRLLLGDRVAFAARFLPDGQLQRLLSLAEADAIATGNLEGAWCLFFFLFSERRGSCLRRLPLTALVAHRFYACSCRWAVVLHFLHLRVSSQQSRTILWLQFFLNLYYL
jgi:hypothetical protein